MFSLVGWLAQTCENLGKWLVEKALDLVPEDPVQPGWLLTASVALDRILL